MMPLGMANVGDVNVIEKITGRDEVRQHLAELGFVVGAQVKVVSEMGGNLILSVKDSRIALDKTMAMRIMVCRKEGRKYEDTAGCEGRREGDHRKAAR